MLLKLTLVTWFLFFVTFPIVTILIQTMSDEEMEHWHETHKLPKRCARTICVWVALGITGILFTILTILLW